MIRLALILALGAGALAAPLTPKELRGRELYRRGAATITATFDDWATTTPANALPCASCHGNDGRGRAEGGATPSDITAARLRRPYAVTTASGRTHGAYDDRALKKAVMMGVDPAGNRLDRVMPRYSMPQSDWEDLLAWLRILGTVTDPGVSEAKLRLGVILPPSGAREMREGVRQASRAWFAEVNARGGIFGREVELAFCEQSGTASQRAAAVARCIDESDVFALVASFTEGAEREIAAVAEEKEIPLLAGVASNPRGSIAPGRYVRELLAGLVEQSAALVRLAGVESQSRGRAVVVWRDTRLADVRDAAMARLREEGFTAVEAVDAATLDPGELQKCGTEVLLILDGEAAARLRDAARASAWKPLLLVPAAFAGDALVVDDVATRTFVSVPMLPGDASAEARGKYRAVELATLASASLAVDALTRAGRALTRDAFLDALDATWRYASGFAPPLTFGRARRIGSTGCHVVMLRPGEPARSLWVDTSL